MLTPRQNLIETITPGGHPDRLVKQYEPYGFLFASPLPDEFPMPGQPPVVDSWGVTKQWAEGTPGPFPIHDAEHIVVKDIENWRDYVHAPDFKNLPDVNWEPLQAMEAAVDRSQLFCLLTVAPGIFEQCHYLCEIVNTLEYLYEYPDEMKELVKYITDYEMVMAEEYCRRLHPDAILHHDDWGMQASTFMSPDMFAEFFLESYKQIYGYYRENGVELIVHHSDSYAATLVPYMIEMGIDIWQGVLDTNNIPDLIDRYGGQISFHGGLNNGVYDVENWSYEAIEEGLVKLYESVEPGRFLIPGLCAGGPGSVYPEVYAAVDEVIEKVNERYFS